MAFRDLREWIDRLESEGELKRVKAEVNWDLELAAIARTVLVRRGPALLFENITGYNNSASYSRSFFVGGLGSRERVALMLGLPKGTDYKEMVRVVRKRFKELVKPRRVSWGPVKENIVRGADVDLFRLPVPKWHILDGGRYINTFCGVVTKDPETGETNVGLYRGMISDRNTMPVWLVPSQGWGVHYQKYREMGKPMPVAVVYGWDEVLPFIAAAPVEAPEYDVMGAIRQEPVELVKCETSDLEVPASAEIVIEGTVSPDPATYELEGPFGEAAGYYGGSAKRPVLKVDCITYRNGAILRGQVARGVRNEIGLMGLALYPAIIWNILEAHEIPGVLDIVAAPLTIVKIHKTYRGQAKRIASAIWASRMALMYCKIVMVVEEDVDIYDPRDVQLALVNRVSLKEGLFLFPDFPGDIVDPSEPPEAKDELVFGTGRQDKLLIDATTNWDIHPPRKEWGGKRLPPLCTKVPPEIEELVKKRWTEYGL